MFRWINQDEMVVMAERYNKARFFNDWVFARANTEMSVEEMIVEAEYAYSRLNDILYPDRR